MGRVFIYWTTCLLSVWGMTIVWQCWSGSVDLQSACWDSLATLAPGMLGSLLLVPMILVDMVRLSSRIVSPITRLRSNMERMAEGERVLPMRIRATDFWCDTATAFNDMLDRFQATNVAVDVEQRDGACDGSRAC